MLYKKKTFSVPATEGTGDCSRGHAMPDRKGKCIRCGEKVSEMEVSFADPENPGYTWAGNAS